MEERKWNEEKSIYEMSVNFVRNGILTSEEEEHLLELLEDYGQLGKHQIVFSMLLSTIEENQLKKEEKQKIRQLLLENRKRRENREEMNLKNASLASIVHYVMEESIDTGNYKMHNKERCHNVFSQCFQDNSIGKMDVAGLTEDLIEELMIDAARIFEMDKADMEVFMGLLQLGLNEASKNKMLQFPHDRDLYKKYIAVAKSRNYIRSNYTSDEVECIKNWISREMDDIRSLAVGLWFAGGISPEEIAGLETSEIKKIKGTEEMVAIRRPESGGYLILTEERREIIQTAMSINMGEKYLFSIKLGLKSKKLAMQSMAMKLYHICQKLGIDYKKFHDNDVLYII